MKEVTASVSKTLLKYAKGSHWFLFLVCGRFITPRKATVQQIAECFIFCQRERELLLPVEKGYHFALNQVFFLVGVDLAKNMVISILTRRFKKSCFPWEIQPPAWNVALVLRSLI